MQNGQFHILRHTRVLKNRAIFHIQHVQRRNRFCSSVLIGPSSNNAIGCTPHMQSTHRKCYTILPHVLAHIEQKDHGQSFKQSNLVYMNWLPVTKCMRSLFLVSPQVNAFLNRINRFKRILTQTYSAYLYAIQMVK